MHTLPICCAAVLFHNISKAVMFPVGRLYVRGEYAERFRAFNTTFEKSAQKQKIL